MTELNPADLAPEDMFVVVDDSAGVSGTKRITARSLALVTKKYIALLTQSGENAPTADEISNGINTVPTLQRTDTGVYTITAAQKFPIGKTRIFPIDASGFSAIITHTDASTITVQTFDGDGLPADDLLSGHLFEVSAYLS